MSLMVTEVNDVVQIAQNQLFQQWKLTDREQQIAALVLIGYNNREIGEKLYISEKTVKNHVSEILTKAHTENREKLIVQLLKLVADSVSSQNSKERNISNMVEQSKPALRKMVIEDMVAEAYDTAKEKGWHDKSRDFLTAIALIHSELSEAVEAYRKAPEDQMHAKMAEELADAVIRILDASAEFGLDLASALVSKMEKNKTREYRHGGKRA